MGEKWIQDDFLKPVVSEKPSNQYLISRGAIVYPTRYRFGVELQESIIAERTPRKDRGGYTNYIALETMTVFREGRYWSLPKGTLFGAYSRIVKKLTK